MDLPEDKKEVVLAVMGSSDEKKWQVRVKSIQLLYPLHLVLLNFNIGIRWCTSLDAVYKLCI